MAANIPLSPAETGPQAPVDRELIDQYSRTVTGVAAAVSPSVVPMTSRSPANAQLAVLAPGRPRARISPPAAAQASS